MRVINISCYPIPVLSSFEMQCIPNRCGRGRERNPVLLCQRTGNVNICCIYSICVPAPRLPLCPFRRRRNLSDPASSNGSRTGLHLNDAALFRQQSQACQPQRRKSGMEMPRKVRHFHRFAARFCIFRQVECIFYRYRRQALLRASVF